MSEIDLKGIIKLDKQIQQKDVEIAKLLAKIDRLNYSLEQANKEIERLKTIINELEIEANRNIHVCNNRGYNLISSIDEVKTLDDFTINEYIGYLVSLEILDKLNELKGDSSNE